MRPGISQSPNVDGGHDGAAPLATEGRLGARGRCHRGVSGLFVIQNRLFFVEGRIAKRPLCAARIERAS